MVNRVTGIETRAKVRASRADARNQVRHHCLTLTFTHTITTRRLAAPPTRTWATWSCEFSFGSGACPTRR